MEHVCRLLTTASCCGCFRARGVVPEIRVRGGPLAAEIRRARLRLRAVLSGLLFAVQGIRSAGQERPPHLRTRQPQRHGPAAV